MVERSGGPVEGGVRHRLLGVVDIQEKSRLHPACTQIPVAEGYRDGTREESGDLAAGPAASTRALTNSGPVPSERMPGTGPVGPRVVDMLRFKILQENRNKVVRQQKLGLDQITLLLRFLLKNKRRRIKHGRNISKRTVLSRCRVL